MTVLHTFVREIKLTNSEFSSNDTVTFHTIFPYLLFNNTQLLKAILLSCRWAYTQAQLSICEDVIPKFLIGSLGGELNESQFLPPNNCSAGWSKRTIKPSTRNYLSVLIL